MNKCQCGYECRFAGESEMLAQYGCAKTIVKRSGPFGSLSVTMCPYNPSAEAFEDPTGGADDDGSELAEIYKKLHGKK